MILLTTSAYPKADIIAKVNIDKQSLTDLLIQEYLEDLDLKIVAYLGAANTKKLGDDSNFSTIQTGGFFDSNKAHSEGLNSLVYNYIYYAHLKDPSFDSVYGPVDKREPNTPSYLKIQKFLIKINIIWKQIIAHINSFEDLKELNITYKGGLLGVFKASIISSNDKYTKNIKVCK